MNNIVKTVLIGASLVLSGCASQTGWSPTIDSYGSPNAHRVGQDTAECKQLASRASGGLGKETAQGAAVGGLLGAATGVAFGAFSGNAGRGAAMGATAGVVGGGAKQGFESEATYKRAFKKCLRNRGHKLID